MQLNLRRLASVLKDYGKYLLGSKGLYFGFRPGILSNEEEVLIAFASLFEGIAVHMGTPGEILHKLASEARTGDVIPEIKE